MSNNEHQEQCTAEYLRGLVGKEGCMKAVRQYMRCIKQYYHHIYDYIDTINRGITNLLVMAHHYTSLSIDEIANIVEHYEWQNLLTDSKQIRANLVIYTLKDEVECMIPYNLKNMTIWNLAILERKIIPELRDKEMLRGFLELVDALKIYAVVKYEELSQERARLHDLQRALYKLKCLDNDTIFRAFLRETLLDEMKIALQRGKKP